MSLGDPNLLGRALREDATYPGQADWARPDATTTCAQCAYWQAAEQWMRKTRSKARCGLAARMMQRPTKQVPATAKSCRFYEPCGTVAEARRRDLADATSARPTGETS